MKVLAVVPRVYVSDVNSNLDFYKKLLNAEPKGIMQVKTMEIARFDQIVMIAGADTNSLRVTATIVVDSLDEAKDFVMEAGGEVLVGPATVPSGNMMIARNPDGNVFEYLQPIARG